MKTYVVMPHYIVTDELKELAINAIKSFKENTEAIVISVDDGSLMDTKFLKDLSDVYIKNDKNSGFAITCNNGFRWIMDNIQDDCYIVCANNDIEVNKRTIPGLIEPFNMFDNVAITGICSSIEKIQEGVTLEDYKWGSMAEGGLLRDRMQDGGLWMSKKSILQKIDLFDEQFIRGGYEDWDIFLRARDTFKMKIIMNGRAWYWHKQGATRWNCENNGLVNNFGYESKKIEDENCDRFMKKWKFNPHTTMIWRNNIIFNE